MPTLGKPKPRLLKYVDEPDNVGAVELSKAQPVYIAGLPTAEVTAAAFAALVARVEALEAETP